MSEVKERSFIYTVATGPVLASHQSQADGHREM